MKPSITPQDFVTMQQTARCLIECIFQKEESFKDKFINGNWGWAREPYELERVHLSSNRVRVTIKFDEDYSTTDIYLCLDEVYGWWENEFEKESKL